MKKILCLLVFIRLTTIFSYAQCGNIMVSASIPQYPDTINNIPNAYRNSSYSAVIQFYANSSIPPLIVNSITFNSVSGLPTGFTYSSNPSSGILNANNAGCIIINSTNVQAFPGVYPITINATINSTNGPVPLQISGYKVRIAPYPILPIDSIQFVNQARLLDSTANTLPDYTTPVFKNTTYQDTVTFEGVVVTNPKIYGLSIIRKAAYMQRIGGGPWSSVLVMCEPSGTGTTLANLLTETNFYQNFVRGKRVRVTGVIRDFSGETQINLIRNNSNFSNAVELLSLNDTTITYSEIPVSDLIQGGQTSSPLAQKQTAERWEGAPVIIRNVIVNSITSSGNRSFWTVRDNLGNVIDVRDFSAYFRRDDNEDTLPKVANTFQPPPVGTPLTYIRGIVTEFMSSGSRRYGIAPQYNADVKICDSPCVAITISSVACAFINSNSNISVSQFNVLNDTAYLEYSLNPLFTSLAKIDTIRSFGPSVTSINSTLNITPGTYYIRLRLKNGGISSNTLMQKVSAPINLNIADTSIAFKQDSILLTAPTGAYTYLWNNGRTTQNIWVKINGNFTVKVQDQNGCSATDSTQVLLVKGIQQKDTAICAGNNISLSILGNLPAQSKVQWSTNDTTTSITVSPTTNTTYRCTQRIGSYTFTDSIRVSVATLPALPDTSIAFKADSILLDAGAGHTKYVWSTGDTTQTIWAKNASVYKVTVAGCSATDSTQVLIVKGIQQKDTTICAGSSINLSIPSSLPRNGLVGWWPFNGNANDESGNGNNGMVNGPTLTTDRLGQTNKAYNFQSVHSVIDLPEISTSLGTANSSASYSIWFLGESSPSNNTVGVLLSATSAPYDYQIRFEVFRSVGGLTGIGPKVYYRCPSENNEPTFVNNYNTANWHNITVSINGVLGQYNYYFDGVLIPQMCFTFNGSSNYFNQNRQWKIGTINPWPNSVSHQFYGKIDDIGIWNRALTQQEITALYNGSANTQSKVQWSTNDTTTSITVSPTANTTYRCTQRIGSFSFTDSVRVSLRNLPDKIVSTPKLGLCKNDNIALTAASGYTYQWKKGNNSLAQTQILNAAEAGAYTVTLT
ncbi:MAG: LamG-like jellyroll fold domain-containing protein, partial [Bacteroidota bacterium]